MAQASGGPQFEDPEPAAGVRTGDVGSIDRSNFAGGNLTLIEQFTNIILGDGGPGRDRRNRDTLLGKVESFWVKGVLDTSLLGSVPIQVGREVAPEAVERPWELIPEGQELARRVDADSRIDELFEAQGRALLILGEPGAGKTITLLELARSAIERARTELDRPIPVFLKLSSWAKQQRPIADWVVEELASNDYGISRSQCTAWVRDDNLLLLLDGLDEVGPAHRAACVQALNRFRDEYGSIGVAITSRPSVSPAPGPRLKLNCALRLKQLTDRQIESYLDDAVPKPEHLIAALRVDPALRELARSPLMLSIMRLAHEEGAAGRTDEELSASVVEGSEKVFSAYITRMLKRRPSREYTPDQTRGWLEWLARRMQQHSLAIFALEDLQPSWLENGVQCWCYAIGSRLAAGAAVVLASIPPVMLALRREYQLPETFHWLLFVGLSVAISWLGLGLSDGSRLQRNSRIPPGGHTWISRVRRFASRIPRVVYWIVVIVAFPSICIYLLTMLAFRPIPLYPIACLVASLAFVLLAAGRRARTLSGDIQTVESLRWSWPGFRLGFLFAGILPAILTFALTAYTYDPPARLWESRRGTLQATLQGDSVNSATFSPTGARLVTTRTKGNPRMWDVASGHLIAELDDGPDEHGYRDLVQFSHSGARLVTVGPRDWKAYLWDGLSGRRVAILDSDGGIPSHRRYTAAFSPDDAHLVIPDAQGTSPQMWDAMTASRVVILKEGDPSEKVSDILFSPDGSKLVTRQGNTLLRDGRSGARIAILEGSDVVFSPDGRRIATTTRNELHLWDGISGDHIWRVDLTGTDGSVSFAFDSSRLAIDCSYWAPKGCAPSLLDARDGRLIAALRQDSTSGNATAVFSPDGTRILTTVDLYLTRGDSHIEQPILWNAGDGSRIDMLAGQSITSATFRSDSAVILTTGEDGTARLWDGHDGHLVRVLEKHAAGVTTGAFSPDGSRIATASATGKARLWDGHSYQLLATLDGHQHTFRLAFSPDGTRILTTSSAPTDSRALSLLWLLLGLLIGTMRGVRSGRREIKVSPNEGTWLSVRSGLILGIVGGFALALLLAVVLIVVWPESVLWPSRNPGLNLVTLSWLTGTLVALWYGGLDVLQHFVLRLILWRKGRIPWHYSRFLDGAADQILLRKVGGGYIFIHRLLLEHFASTAPPPPESHYS